MLDYDAPEPHNDSESRFASLFIGNCGPDFCPTQAYGNSGRQSWVKTYPLWPKAHA